MLPVKTLLVHRVGEIPNNASDQSVYNYEYDYTIDNNGTLDDLDSEVLFFMNHIFKNELNEFKSERDTVDKC